MSLLLVALIPQLATGTNSLPRHSSPFCHSFAVVIQQLPNPLRDAICIFYLVLRGLDTVEDDMAIPVQDKLPALLRFHDDIYDRCDLGNSPAPAHSNAGHTQWWCERAG